MERHFLRVIERNAWPHSPKEREYFEHYLGWHADRFPYESKEAREEYRSWYAYEDYGADHNYEYEELVREPSEWIASYADGTGRNEDEGWFYDDETDVHGNIER